jgi:hypothetical protein
MFVSDFLSPTKAEFQSLGAMEGNRTLAACFQLWVVCQPRNRASFGSEQSGLQGVRIDPLRPWRRQTYLKRRLQCFIITIYTLSAFTEVNMTQFSRNNTGRRDISLPNLD